MSESKIMTAVEAIVYMEKGGAVTLADERARGKYFFTLEEAADSLAIHVHSTAPNIKDPVKMKASMYPEFLNELYLEYDHSSNVH